MRKRCSVLNRCREDGRAGMSLVEILIAMSISLLVVSAALWLMVEGMAVSWKTSNVSGNDLSHWGLSNRLVFDSRTANRLRVYSEFDEAAILKEWDAGLSYYGDEDAASKRLVGNFLVLSRTSFDEKTRKMGFDRLIGYVFNSAGNKLQKFDFAVPEEDVKAGLSIAELLKKHLDTLRSSLADVTSDISLPSVGAGAQGAFYWDFADTSKRSQRSTLRFLLGDPAKHKRVRDCRVVEVSFFIRP